MTTLPDEQQEFSYRRVALLLAMALSAAGIAVSLTLGVVWLAQLNWIPAVLIIFIGAPYCFAVTIVFHHVLRAIR